MIILPLVMALSLNEVAEACLSKDEARVVRNAVYLGKARFVSDPLKRLELFIPDDLTKLYKAKPQAVIDLLVRIVEGANPSDSYLAAGYAIGLIRGPKIAVMYMSPFTKEDYDVVDKETKMTERELRIERIREKKESKEQ